MSHTISYTLSHIDEQGRYSQVNYQGRSLPLQTVKAKNGGYLLHFFGESFSVELKPLYVKIFTHQSHAGPVAYFDKLRDLNKFLRIELDLIFEPASLELTNALAARVVNRNQLKQDIKRALETRVEPFHKDLVTLNDVRKKFKNHTPRSLQDRNLRGILKELGCVPLGQIRATTTNLPNISIWAIQRAEYWMEQTAKQMKAEYYT